jgi:hypothetical protein
VGRSLLADPAPEAAVVVGPMQRGVRTADGWTVEWDSGDQALHASAGYRVRDHEYRVVPGDRAHVSAGVAAAIGELRAFFQ